MITNKINRKISLRTIFTILAVPTILWFYISYSRQGFNRIDGTIALNYKPYPFNRGIIHHIIYLDSPILEKPLNLSNYWIWTIIIMVLVVFITLLNILVNIVSLSGEKEQ